MTKNRGSRDRAEPPPGVSTDALYHALRTSWSPETNRQWSPGNPARGQCSVTALVVHDTLGGDILKTDVAGAWHFYNRVGGLRWDFTVSQFEAPVGYADLPSTREEALADTSAAQYDVLSDRVTLRLFAAAKSS